MNLEHYKAASERTDADERALVPAIKRTPNKAQGQAAHSPLPWSVDCTSNMSDESHSIYCIADDTWLFSTSEANAKLIVASVNHAEKLAEALRKVEAKLGEHEGKDDPRSGELIIAAYYLAADAIKAYEDAQ